MKRMLLFLLLLAALPAFAVDSAPQADTRAVRELESLAYGKPSLPEEAQRGELALSLAGISLAAATPGSTASQSFGNQDYDALYALLERYRDDLLKMGLESSELDAQMKVLKTRSEELKARLDQLKPKDGMKIHARIYNFFDTMNVTGDAALESASGNLKPAGQDVRYQVGGSHAELQLTGTRGLLSAYAQLDITAPWGNSFIETAGRRVYVEMRLPVAIQFGDIDADISPLTLWRNDRDDPFEPEPFLDRETRLREDVLLVPNKWTVQGGRLSTEAMLFGVQPLDLESTTFLAGYAAQPVYTFSPNDAISANRGTQLSVNYNTFGEAWRVALPIAGMVTLANNGMLFWDDNATNAAVTDHSLNSMVYSGALDVKLGIFHAGAEYALSSYTAPEPDSVTAMPNPMTGTALTYFAGVEGKSGHLKVFGKSVDNSFDSPGAQGRTVDEGYQGLGYFLPENSQVAADGTEGIQQSGHLGAASTIPIGFASRLNTVLIPPGTGGPWSHLLNYSPVDNLDPYGDATPNRSGYGVDGQWKLFKDFLIPSVSYESDKELSNVFDRRTGAMTTPFTMTRMRAGIVFDFKPLLGWPIRLEGGYTMDSAANGANDIFGKTYGLNSVLMEGGATWDLNDTMGLQAGYRHLDVNGFNETFTVFPGYGLAQDILGYGMWWLPVKDMRMDIMFDQMYSSTTLSPSLGFEAEEGLLRVEIYF
jgi:hypothetical protein